MCEFENKNIEIADFIKRHKISPYDIGGKIYSKSTFNFNINDIKHTIKGKLSIDANNGWMKNPDLLNNIFKVLGFPLSDTFYFEKMSGEFDIYDSAAFFNNFYMEKNGYSIEYSGKIDFNNNIFINGHYIIDLNIADTGPLEKLLRHVYYTKDSIIFDFKIDGDYKKPKVRITHSSISDFLKNKTQKFVDDFVDKINNLF